MLRLMLEPHCAPAFLHLQDGVAALIDGAPEHEWSAHWLPGLINAIAQLGQQVPRLLPPPPTAAHRHPPPPTAAHRRPPPPTTVHLGHQVPHSALVRLVQWMPPTLRSQSAQHCAAIAAVRLLGARQDALALIPNANAKMPSHSSPTPTTTRTLTLAVTQVRLLGTRRRRQVRTERESERKLRAQAKAAKAAEGGEGEEEEEEEEESESGEASGEEGEEDGEGEVGGREKGGVSALLDALATVDVVNPDPNCSTPSRPSTSCSGAWSLTSILTAAQTVTLTPNPGAVAGAHGRHALDPTARRRGPLCRATQASRPAGPYQPEPEPEP